MGSMASSPKVSLLFPLGMAIRHRASSLFSLLVFALPSTSAPFVLHALSLWLRRLRISWYWASSWYSRIVPTWYAVVCRIDVTTATQLFNQRNQFSPPSGHWNPETLEPRVEAPRHWNLGTLEPQVHMEGKGHRPENRQRAPTQGTALSGSGIPPWQSPAVSPLRVSLPSCSWRLRRPG